MPKPIRYRDTTGTVQRITLIDFQVKLPSVESLFKKYGKCFIKKKSNQIDDQDHDIDAQAGEPNVPLIAEPLQPSGSHVVDTAGKLVINLERYDEHNETAEPKGIQESPEQCKESESDYVPTDGEEQYGSTREKRPNRRRIRPSSRKRKNTASESATIALRSGYQIKKEPIPFDETYYDSVSIDTSGSENEYSDENEQKCPTPKKYNLRKRERISDSDSDVPGPTNKTASKKKKIFRILSSSSEDEDINMTNVDLPKTKLEEGSGSQLTKLGQSSPAQTHVCNKCKSSFALRVQLNKHIRGHERKQRSRRGLKIKLLKKHNVWNLIKSRSCLHSKQKIGCLVCSVQRKQEKAKSIPPSLTLKSKSNTCMTKHRCKFCLKTYTLSSYLQIHEELHSGDKPYHCRVCLKYFPLEEDLRQHRMIHTKKSLKNFTKCCYCAKRFSGRHLQLTQHLRSKHRVTRTKSSKNTTDPGNVPVTLNFGELICKEEEKSPVPELEVCSPDTRECPSSSTTDVITQDNLTTEQDSEDLEEIGILRIVPIERLMDTPPESPPPQETVPETESSPGLPETITLYFENNSTDPTEDPLAEKPNPLENQARQYLIACPYCDHRGTSTIALQEHCLQYHLAKLKTSYFICPHLLCSQRFRDVLNVRIHQIMFHDMLHISTGHEYCTVLYKEVCQRYTGNVSSEQAMKLKLNMKSLLTSGFQSRIKILKSTKEEDSMNIICPFCSIVCQSYNEINNHANTFHADLDHGLHKFKCPHDTCDRRFGAIIGLLDHELLVHQVNFATPKIVTRNSEITSSSSPTPGTSISALPDPNISSTTSPTPLVQCPYCKETWKDVQELHQHGYIHASAVVVDQNFALKFLCPFKNCNSPFDTFPQMLHHTETHRKRLSASTTSLSNSQSPLLNKNPQVIDLTLEDDNGVPPNSTPQPETSVSPVLESLLRNSPTENSNSMLAATATYPNIQSQSQQIQYYQNTPVAQTRTTNVIQYSGGGGGLSQQSPVLQQAPGQTNQMQRIQNPNIANRTGNVSCSSVQYPISTPQQIRPASGNNSLVQHQRTSTEAWRCDKCLHAFPTLADLSEHYKVHYQYICYFCKIRFLTIDEAGKHMKIPHLYNCTYTNCEMSFETPIHLNIHLNNHLMQQSRSIQSAQQGQQYSQPLSSGQATLSTPQLTSNVNTEAATNGNYLSSSNNPLYLSTQTPLGNPMLNTSQGLIERSFPLPGPPALPGNLASLNGLTVQRIIMPTNPSPYPQS